MSVNERFHGVLRKNPVNPRYFTDDTGRAILLSGSHTWETIQELRLEGQGAETNFDYDGFLAMLKENGHNFSRYWQWGYCEWAPWTDEKVIFEPLPYERTGPGLANDGKPKFDLDRFNEAYFKRLRERVEKAGELGIYVSVQFFDGWCQRYANKWSDPWPSHPYNVSNNINGVDADPDRTGKPLLFVLDFPQVLEYQKAFIRKTIDTLNDLDNVLWEIINEAAMPEHFAKIDKWHDYMVSYVKEYEASKPKQHMVGKTAAASGVENEYLFVSDADWITVEDNKTHDYRYNPPAADGRKIVIADTDHSWGHGGTYIWAWKTFLSGMHPIFMDPWEPVPGRTIPGYPGTPELNRRDYAEWGRLRKNLGYILSYAERIDLNHCVPRKDVAYGHYCLAWEGEQYLVYIPEDCQLRLNMSYCEGEYDVEWFSPRTGEKVKCEPVKGGEKYTPFISPFGVDVVLLVTKRR